MKLSIVTINYNNAEGLERTLNSVLNQSYEEIEHIIVDGASTDKSVDVIKEYVGKAESGKRKVEWVSEKDNGIYHAMNKGIRKASGEYIQILNSGDILAAPDVTERMCAELARLEIGDRRLNNGNQIDDRCIDDRLTSIPILYGNMMKAYSDGKVERDNCGDAGATDSFLYFYRGTLNHDCAYIRRDLFDKYGLYNEDMKICSDWEWYVRAIALGGEQAVYTNIDVTIFDMNGVSENGGKNAELIKRERREYLEKILPPSILKDYDAYTMPIRQYERLKRHHIWPLVNFVERILFKLEKWHILK